MVQDYRYLGKGLRQIGYFGHVFKGCGDARHQIVLSEEREPGPEVFGNQVVTIGEVAYALEARGRCHVSTDDPLGVGTTEVDVSHDRLREAGSLKCLFQPDGLIDRIRRADGGLNVYRLNHPVDS